MKSVNHHPASSSQRYTPLIAAFIVMGFSHLTMADVQSQTQEMESKVIKKAAKPLKNFNAIQSKQDNKTAPALAGTQSVASINTELTPVVVTAASDQKLAISKAEVALSPGGVSLIDINALHDRNISSIADFFRYIPGVWATSQSGNDEVFLTSRGSNLDANNFAGSGIKLLQDGMPVTAADGNNHNRMIDPLASSFATVARGGNAFKYGASTLGGAVDFTSPTAYDNPAMRLLLNGGSFGQFLGRGTVSKVFNESIDGLLTVEGKEWDGYRAHNQQDRVGVYGNLGWQITDNVVNRTFVSYIKNNQQLPGQLTRAQFNANPYQASSQALAGNYQLNTETERVANKTSWTIDEKSSLELGFSYENQQLYHPIVSKVLLPNVNGGLNDMFSMLVDSNQQDWGSTARYKLRLDTHDLLLGLNFGTNSDKGGNYTNNAGLRGAMTNRITKKADNIEIFAQDHWHFADNWTLTPAVQGVFAHRQVMNNRLSIPQDQQANFLFAATPNFYPLGGYSNHNYSGINPSLGLMYDLTKNSSLYSNISRLYAPPTNYNIADNITSGVGTPYLKAMEGTSAEIGTRGSQSLDKFNNINWDLSLYYSWLNNEILSTTPPGGSAVSTNFNNTIHAGIEGLLGGRFALDAEGTHSLEPLVSFTINHFRFDNDPTYANHALPAAPDYFLKGEAIYHHASGFYLGPTVDVVGQRWGDYANTYKISPYSLLGMRTGWSNKNYKVFLEGRNLLDKVYVANTNIMNTASATDAMLNAGAPLSFYGGIEITY
ncbi:TonB-dependent receptor [Methylomonas sp. AM2-LC]|uniref:TonB-dependent receptor family protein n=1 Tax=Methylomonas sp. AM2-LC TaxID=3153301 RepID=UPI003265DDC1